MSWHRHGRGGRRSYHHGNLREALVDAALDLIAEKGPAGFTFAEAARQAGVSPAAPYRHFRDRDALMADVARRGFERFEKQLAAAWDEGRPNLRQAFERVGKAYLAFRAQRACLLLGHVRSRACRSASIASCRRPATAHLPCCAAPARRSLPSCRRPSARPP